MAAIVCHGFQSCLESQLVESRALSLSFPFPSKIQQNPIDLPFKTSLWDSSNTNKTYEKQNKTDTNTGFSFLQALSNASHVSKESPNDKETIYVHPQAKRSSRSMSQKSLELCTEKLGNESGSDIVENDNAYEDMNLMCSLATREKKEEIPRVEYLGRIRKTTRRENFPPPLTTLGGSESMRMRSHREDGRLVVEAIRVPPIVSCFQAERSNGRLRLCLLKNGDNKFDPEEIGEQEEEEIGGDSEGVEEGSESDGEDGEIRGQVEETGEEEEAGEDGEEMRRKEFERPRGCKEGRQNENNDSLNNWGEPLFVAIS